MQSRPPQIREDFSEVQALKRCIRRRNSQVALILAVVLISLSACLMPQTSRDRFVGNNGSIQKNEYGQQKTSEWLFRESTLDAPFSFRSRLGRRYQGGGLMGKPVIDTHRGDSVFRRDRAGKVLAYRGGAAGDAAGANSSNARTSGRGRGVLRFRGGQWRHSYMDPNLPERGPPEPEPAHSQNCSEEERTAFWRTTISHLKECLQLGVSEGLIQKWI